MKNKLLLLLAALGISLLSSCAGTGKFWNDGSADWTDFVGYSPGPPPS